MNRLLVVVGLIDSAHTVLDLEERYLEGSVASSDADSAVHNETTSGPRPKKEFLRTLSTIPSATETACPPRGFTNKLPPDGGQRQLSGYQSRPSRISMALLAHRTVAHGGQGHGTWNMSRRQQHLAKSEEAECDRMQSE
ncbi:hypothetical protein HYALB_00010917 [Hymenoscyphus albidus]|uniref:Uncharacterized protein n=1 Tax=Hymenoscyphus albidus TaxID=595503 RepID=A0A9N9LET0_9HELO|nr:hypothetical protein HYALB_00010917 [Hymenoscyphus albidus]